MAGFLDVSIEQNGDDHSSRNWEGYCHQIEGEEVLFWSKC